MEIKEMISRALAAKERAYVPYSKYHVGACIETENGEIYEGCNIENASFTPTICAERTAIFKAVYDGHRKIKRVVVVGDSEFTYPCGVCRQVMREFAKDAQIIIAKNEEEYRVYTLNDLLPYGFGPEELNGGAND